MHRLREIPFPRGTQFVQVTARLVGAVPLGYAVISMWVALVSALFAAMGAQRGDAVVLSGMTGFVMYLVWLLWAFSARRVGLVYLVALLGGTSSAGLLWLMQLPGS